VALERLAHLGQRREDHVRAHGGHLRVRGERGADLHDAAAVGLVGQVGGRALGGVVRRGLLGLVGAHEALEALDQRLRRDVLLAGLVDRVQRGRQHVEALEADVDGLALEAAAPLAQQLEDVLHLVGQRGHAGEAHRRAHALQRVRAAEDLVDRVLVVRALLDPNDRQVELLQVLAALGEEHREVLGDLH
jgi:hypothetical protein